MVNRFTGSKREGHKKNVSSVVTYHQDGIVEVKIEGYIDAYTCEEIERSFNRLVEKKIFKLVVDMSEVRYLSSVGAGLLINMFSYTQENKGKLVILNPSAEAKEVLDLLGLSNLFPITNDRATALNSVLSLSIV